MCQQNSRAGSDLPEVINPDAKVGPTNYNASKDQAGISGECRQGQQQVFRYLELNKEKFS